jgi:hypothetical protein
MITDDSKGKEGKAGVWRASFGSPLQRGVKAYTWSGEATSDRGINPGTEDTYSPTNTSTQIFDVAFLKVDSDKALEVAQKHGGDKLAAKDPDTPILYVLDWSSATNELIWHVIYGVTRDDYKLKVAVNASSGILCGWKNRSPAVVVAIGVVRLHLSVRKRMERFRSG